MLWFFSIRVESKMMVTKKYAYYCWQAYFVVHHFIPVVHWLLHCGCTIMRMALFTEAGKN